MKILVADDETDVRDTIAEYLALHGHDVLAAANGLETLVQVKHARPDAVVLDLRMPRLGGIEALKRIRAFDPSIVVVVLTADVDETVHRRASALGARAVLVKPVALPHLLAALAGVAAPPVTPAKPALTEPVETSVPARTASATRVLLIDDDDAVRELLAEFLTGRGYEVLQAARAAAGIAVLADTAVEVVLLDIEMPGLSGADALPTIRAVAPRAAIIMVSGTADEATAKRTLAYGAFDYLVKPIDFAYLVQSLETALAVKALESG